MVGLRIVQLEIDFQFHVYPETVLGGGFHSVGHALVGAG